MSVLAALVKAYERLPGAPPFGFSSEKVGFLISLTDDGSVAHVVDLREGEGRRKQAQMMPVPRPVKRTAGIAPNTFWDKTSYALGVTAGEGKRTAKEHSAFVNYHSRLLLDATDPGLLALHRFLEHWTPDQFVPPIWVEDMKDQNVVFGLEADRLRGIPLHDRQAAKSLWAKTSAEGDDAPQICLVSGNKGPVARLHPSIKGVWGTQTSGATLVSFNQDAFTSYGHDQGDNAPVSEAVAFAYTTALNHFLQRDSRQRMQIGDTSTVFWATSPNEQACKTAEKLFTLFFDPKMDLVERGTGTGLQLERIRAGAQLNSVSSGLEKDVRFHVLGLAPNAARLSIRFYFEDDFDVLTRNYQRFVDDMRIEPSPRESFPPLWKYLSELAVQGKWENVPPNVAGEWMRAILSASRYPLTLLSNTLMRIRSDGEINALRVGMLKAVLCRNYNKEVPVAFDPDNKNKGYLLGRLFAVFERAQTAAYGLRLNATIKDKYYSPASSQPRRIFAMLQVGLAHHLSMLGKQSPGRRINLEKLIISIMDNMEPGANPFPAYLPVEDQALFGLGYYHQRNEFFKTLAATADNGEPA